MQPAVHHVEQAGRAEKGLVCAHARRCSSPIISEHSRGLVVVRFAPLYPHPAAKKFNVSSLVLSPLAWQRRITRSCGAHCTLIHHCVMVIACLLWLRPPEGPTRLPTTADHKAPLQRWSAHVQLLD
jgi:hypothetical protein